MQFFPISSNNVSALGGVSVPAASYMSSEPNAFLDSFNEELAASGVTPVVDTNEEYLLPRGFRAVKRDVSARLDQEDGEAILAGLRKRGMSDASLSGLEGLLASGNTMSMGSILGALGKRGRATGDLTDDELSDLNGILRKMNFSGEEAEELLSMMQDGRSFSALRAINARLGQLGEESTFALSMSELRSLGRGLDLSTDAMRKIAALLGGDGADVDSATLKKLLSPAGEELAAAKAEQEKLAKELKEVIDEALQAKKIREASEPVADTRGSQLTARSETRMRDTLMNKGNLVFSPEEEEELFLNEKQSFSENNARRERNSQDHTAPNETQKTVTAKAAEQGAVSTTEKSPRTDDGFSALLGKVSVASGMTMPPQSASVSPQNTASAGYFNRQDIFSQVEQGMLKQLADGSRQMTLRLDPGDLGQLTLLLTVKNGEVRALIRTDNAETTSLLSEQMNQLRATLEEQGLKVAQLDVETQLPQDTTRDAFSGMAHYNQEQTMREKERMARLARIRREAGTSLARDVQSMKAKEEISPSGLHIIA